jgi:hypothetical protein
MLLLLCFSSLVVGILSRLVQPFRGIGTAVASGVFAALIILYLWLVAYPGAGIGLVFGPLGILVAVGFCYLGAWLYPQLRRLIGRIPRKTS